MALPSSNKINEKNERSLSAGKARESKFGNSWRKCEIDFRKERRGRDRESKFGNSWGEVVLMNVGTDFGRRLYCRKPVGDAVCNSALIELYSFLGCMCVCVCVRVC